MSVDAQILINWLVHDSADDTKSEDAFDSVLGVTVDLDFSVNATKFINITLDSMNVNSFNVTKDNIGGGVKEDEANILYRL